MFPAHTFTAKPFIFNVQGRAFYLSPERVKATSEPLYTMLTGPMSESVSGEATLEDVSHDTFVRVCNWMYLGVYDREPEKQKQDAYLNNTAAEEKCYAGYPPTFTLGSTKRMRKASRFTRYQTQIKTPNCGPPQYLDSRSAASAATPLFGSHSVTSAVTPTSAFHSMSTGWASVNIPANNNVNPHEVESLMAHAKVYVFADKYLMHDLKLFTLWEMYNVLSAYHNSDILTTKHVEDICEFVRYVYDHTSAGNAELREMASLFLGVEMERFLGNQCFQDMLSDIPDLLRRFLEEVKIRIADP